MNSVIIAGGSGDECARLLDMISTLGYRVRQTKGVEDTRLLCRQLRPIVVFSFYQLVDGTILDLLQGEEGQGKISPCIVVHDYTHSREAATAVARGACGFLPIPIDPQEITECLLLAQQKTFLAGNADGDIRLTARAGVLMFHFPKTFTRSVSSRMNVLVKSSLPIPGRGVILDLCRTISLSSCAITSLFMTFDRYQGLQEYVFITCKQARVRKALEIAGIWDNFRPATSTAEAMAIIAA